MEEGFGHEVLAVDQTFIDEAFLRVYVEVDLRHDEAVKQLRSTHKLCGCFLQGGWYEEHRTKHLSALTK